MMVIEASGKLRVVVESGSMFLSRSLPVEVRDSRQRLVAQETSGSEVVLPAGLYSVSVLLPDGHRAKQVASVKADKETNLVFPGRPAKTPSRVAGLGGPTTLDDYPASTVGGGDRTIDGPLAGFHRTHEVPDRLNRAAFRLERSLFADGAGNPSDGCRDVTDETSWRVDGRRGEVGLATLVSASGAKSHGGYEGGAGAWWDFVPLGRPQTVPIAEFELESKHHVVVSLPVNPGLDYPLNACRVTAASFQGVVTFRTSFAPARTVANTVAGALATGEVVATDGLLQQATDLLFHKYRDPAAAALGALTLHRLGQLEERHGWVHNLAREFYWLPDGAILEAALLSEDPSRRQDGLALLLEATSHRPLYTDGLALAVHLLRRWPDDARKQERRDRIEWLSGWSVGAYWDSMVLTTDDGKAKL